MYKCSSVYINFISMPLVLYAHCSHCFTYRRCWSIDWSMSESGWRLRVEKLVWSHKRRELQLYSRELSIQVTCDSVNFMAESEDLANLSAQNAQGMCS